VGDDGWNERVNIGWPTQELRAVEMGEAYPRYAKFILVSNMNVLDGHLKVVDDFGDQRGYETLGFLGVLYKIRIYMR